MGNYQLIVNNLEELLSEIRQEISRDCSLRGTLVSMRLQLPAISLLLELEIRTLLLEEFRIEAALQELAVDSPQGRDRAILILAKTRTRAGSGLH